ncbi:hypothetical protein MKY92_14445 [Paenibacillus sp. FSL R5-0623]|uniref:hypothetical protein n=1 Tax=Paenibacillus sp. FSL R5-0623 TaxID=2921651 RepID=UPI0030DBFECA
MNKDELSCIKPLRLICKLAKKETNHSAHDQLVEIAGSNSMIACEEVYEKSPQKPEVVGGLLSAGGLKVFEGYQFLS